MKRLAPIALACALALTGAVASGCGEEEKADPYEILNGAFAGNVPSTPASVEVTSLGYEDKPLRTRTVSVGPAQYRAIREAIASPQAGLEMVVGDIETEGTEDVDGVETEHVSGRLKTEELIGALVVALQNGAGVDQEGELLPGLSELDSLKKMLADGDFDFYAEAGDGSFERLDLTLSLDDRDNALPPTRIRFSLTESDPGEGSS